MAKRKPSKLIANLKGPSFKNKKTQQVYYSIESLYVVVNLLNGNTLYEALIVDKRNNKQINAAYIHSKPLDDVTSIGAVRFKHGSNGSTILDVRDAFTNCKPTIITIPSDLDICYNKISNSNTIEVKDVKGVTYSGNVQLTKNETDIVNVLDLHNENGDHMIFDISDHIGKVKIYMEKFLRVRQTFPVSVYHTRSTNEKC